MYSTTQCISCTLLTPIRTQYCTHIHIYTLNSYTYIHTTVYTITHYARILIYTYTHTILLYPIHHCIYRYADDTPHSKGPNAILHQRSERIMLKTAMKLDSLTERILQAKNLSINQNNSKFGKNTYLTDLEIGRVIISLLYRCILLS